eukprot:411007-Amphidinium_carterae.2
MLSHAVACLLVSACAGLPWEYLSSGVKVSQGQLHTIEKHVQAQAHQGFLQAAESTSRLSPCGQNLFYSDPCPLEWVTACFALHVLHVSVAAECHELLPTVPPWIQPCARHQEPVHVPDACTNVQDLGDVQCEFEVSFGQNTACSAVHWFVSQRRWSLQIDVERPGLVRAAAKLDRLVLKYLVQRVKCLVPCVFPTHVPIGKMDGIHAVESALRPSSLLQGSKTAAQCSRAQMSVWHQPFVRVTISHQAFHGWTAAMKSNFAEQCALLCCILLSSFVVGSLCFGM